VRSQDPTRLPLLSSFGLRVSHVLRAHLNSVARGGEASRGFGACLSRVSVGESSRSSLRRIELESSLHPKEEESGSVKSASCVATIAGPTPATGEDSARGYRARVSYIENLVTEIEGLRLAQRSIRINKTSGCVRGPSRGNRVCKRNAISQRRNGAVRRHVGGKTNESRTGSRHRVHSRCRAANVARRWPKKCTFRWQVVPDRRTA
jgi:hypothetical protein